MSFAHTADHKRAAFPHTLDRWLLTTFALSMIGLGFALFLTPETTSQLFMGTLGSPAPPFPAVMRGCIQFLGCLLFTLGLPILLLAPVDDPVVRKRIALGLFVPSTFLFFLTFFIPAVGSGRLLIIVPYLLAALLLGPFVPGVGQRKPFQGGTRQRWQEQIGEAAAQQERNRLARDLHDSIKQQLFSIRVGSAAVEARLGNDPKGAREALRHVQKSAHEAVVEMQALLLQLRPEALATIGLVEALREQGESLGYRTGAKAEIEIGDLPPDGLWPAGSQEALFRIAQEAMSNVARHARAGRIVVRLSRSGAAKKEAILLEVRDDGQGFSPTVPESGMGLRNMRERLLPFGGSLKISSTLGQGTELAALLPLSVPKERAARKLSDEPAAAPAQRGHSPGIMFAILGSLSIFAQAADSRGVITCVMLAIGVVVLLMNGWPRHSPEVVRQSLSRLFIACTVLWWNPWFSGKTSGLFIGAAVLSFGLGLFEAVDHYLRVRQIPEARGSRIRETLFALLTAALLVSFAALLLGAAPVFLVQAALSVMSVVFIAWWIQDQLSKEALL